MLACIQGCSFSFICGVALFPLMEDNITRGCSVPEFIWPTLVRTLSWPNCLCSNEDVYTVYMCSLMILIAFPHQQTLLESVRLRTLSRFGLQQVQVDVHFLRTFLWSYVADEQVLNVLLDEVVTSASVRCCDPELMEQRVVEFICEQS